MVKATNLVIVVTFSGYFFTRHIDHALRLCVVPTVASQLYTAYGNRTGGWKNRVFPEPLGLGTPFHPRCEVKLHSI